MITSHQENLMTLNRLIPEQCIFLNTNISYKCR